MGVPTEINVARKELNMKREELTALGLEADVIEKIMASHGKDVQSLNAQLEQAKSGSAEAETLRQQLEELQTQGMTESEKASKAISEAQKQNEKLLAELSEMKFRQALADQGITGEMAEGITKAFANKDFSSIAESIGKIASDNKTLGATEKEQEIAKNSINPNGGKPEGDDKEKTEEDKLIESVMAQMKGGASSTADIVNNYK